MSNIRKFEKSYMDLHWEKQRKQYENYIEGKNNDLNSIDEKIYGLVKLYKSKLEHNGEKSVVSKKLIVKELVDKNTDCSQLINFIDDLSNYEKNIHPNILDDRRLYKEEISKLMKKDVLDLMEVRNKHSRENGYKSYPHMILSTSDLSESRLVNFLNRFLDENLDEVKYLINKYNIKWDTWFEDLNKIGVSNNKFDADMIIEDLLSKLDFNSFDNIKFEFKNNGFTGIALSLSQDDIRVVVDEVYSLRNLTILFHEIGHALFYSNINDEGLFKVLPPIIDESFAVVMEYLAAQILLTDDDREKVNEIMLLEYTRCAISALYEFDLWNNPHMAEELYSKYYSKLGITISNPVIWAYDSFRSIDSVYIHNYVIGYKLAKELYQYLLKNYGHNYKKWGNWIYRNVYCSGSKKSFLEIVSKLETVII